MTKSIASITPTLTPSSVGPPSVLGNLVSQGQYSIAFLNSSLSPVVMSVNKKSIGFTGCNSFTIVC
jgi:hypothetical protein